MGTCLDHNGHIVYGKINIPFTNILITVWLFLVGWRCGIKWTTHDYQDQLSWTILTFVFHSRGMYIRTEYTIRRQQCC